MGVRGWPAWLGLWSLAVVGTMFAGCLLATGQVVRDNDPWRFIS